MSLHTPPPWSVFRELNYTPLERDRGERRKWKKKPHREKRQRKHLCKESERCREKWSLLCLARPVIWKNSFLELHTAHTSGPSTQMEPRLAPKRELLYCALPWQQLNQLLLWGSLIVTNTVTETWLSSNCRKGTQSTYRPFLFFSWFTVSFFVQLPSSASWRTDNHAVLLWPI